MSTFRRLPPILPSGLLAVYKPKGLTSSDVVATVKRKLIAAAKRSKFYQQGTRIDLKVGHGGTLDPLATGVLVLGIGEGTKMMSTYLKGSKRYSAVGLLGSATDTLDSEGKEVRTAEWSHVTHEVLKEAAGHFRGDIMQVPPMYSALKVGGKRMYALARKGVEVDRPPRPVTVYSLEVSRRSVLPAFSLDIESSGGFYVRSLIADMAERCGSAAHMTALERTKHGPFELADCLHREEWDDFARLCRHVELCTALAQEREQQGSRVKMLEADDD